MRIAAFGALAALLVVVAGGLVGCQGLDYARPCRGELAQLPVDLPANPDPTKKYCKVWVPATYRKVPKLVQCAPGCEKSVDVTVMETTAREVLVRPCSRKCATTCGTTCNEALVQVKPGGYRWEDCGGCWQYKYRPPQYKWCHKTVKEDGIGYCLETPAEYETVVETRPVRKTRTEYVPPKYRVAYVNEVFTPGHYEWRAEGECACTPDRRRWSTPRLQSKTTTGCPPRPKVALDCGCPPIN
jgi:hypothetical protein